MLLSIRSLKIILTAISFLILQACTTAPPKNTENICETFREKSNWYKHAKTSYQKWGVPIPVQMAIIHQESRFVANAAPPRRKLFGFIPWFRKSSAYGYAQALDATWGDYMKYNRRWSADRDDFADAVDFVGWYNYMSHKRLGLAKSNARQLYLAYHEGHTGYRRQTFLQKPWLLKVAEKVDRKARIYDSQLNSCRNEFKSKSWFFW
ncbi:MAG TPA: hypothetical protein DCZ48_15020 [Methylococcaceae bacterium]|nr:hypothetical protein [Methylococcaceae bacterium]